MCAADDQNSHLDWKQRFDIIYGIAEGLCYATKSRELGSFTGTSKPATSCWTKSSSQKSDFGLARVLCGDRTHLTTGIAGTV